MKRSLPALFGILGPGFAVAAIGIGTGDVVAVSVSAFGFKTLPMTPHRHGKSATFTASLSRVTLHSLP